ncbi:Deoxycytidine monophosphate (dCMP) deaminase [Stygiomarasmius scandens]|uniref:dCMP deaminase n=1 Tax=Marasmiellus scandens TaxID=2682957 RepID=A0ABR1JPX0_9AGAR
MFIAIIGTRCSGKTTVEDYLVSFKGFIPIRIDGENSISKGISGISPNTTTRSNDVSRKHQSFLTFDATPLPSPSPLSPIKTFRSNTHLNFSSPEEVLDHITRHWRANFVTCDLHSKDQVEMFIKRPFFLLISVDAPLYDRFQRQQKISDIRSLEDFVREDDAHRFGGRGSLNELNEHVKIQIVNDFRKLSGLHAHLGSLDLLNPCHLRPDWDTYFMTLASLASQRSNCMKRRVGAILVRDKRILATGYNGTPRHLQNCNEGGCPKCNGTLGFENDLEECVCLHAEENALLEAGRERVGDGAVLYCNTCPCLKCTVKIIQTGVKSVVYNLTYKVDAASARLFDEAGVELRRFDPKTSHLPGLESHLDFDDTNGSMFDRTPTEWD